MGLPLPHLCYQLTLNRYAFRSPEKVALQEIGPRFTLKLRSLRKGLPAVLNLGSPAKPLEFDEGDEEDEAEEKRAEGEMDRGEKMPDEEDEEMAQDADEGEKKGKKVVPPTQDEYEWMWKVRGVLFVGCCCY